MYFIKIFGDENLLNPLINKLKKKLSNFHTDKKISNEDTALTAVKEVNKQMLGLAVESVKKLRYCRFSWQYRCVVCHS